MKAAVLGLLLLLAACTMPGDAARVVKLGVIAPFEGEDRPLGYAILPVVKSEIANANAGGALGRYRLAVVALDDSSDPATAARQARALALDPEVLAVIGPFSAETAASAGPMLQSADLPDRPVIASTSSGAKYAAEIDAVKTAAAAICRALAADISRNGVPSRSGVSAELALAASP